YVTLSSWERLTANPGISAISDFSLQSFRDARHKEAFRGQAEKRAATVNKDLRNIRSILRRVGPRGDRNPAGQGILPSRPDCQPRPADPIRKRIAVRSELAAIYPACDVAIWPAQRVTGVPPPRLWRALYVCELCWGANVGDLLRLTPESI